MIGAPEHGEDIVDVINDCDKRYLKEKIYIVSTTEADGSTKRMKDCEIVGETKSRF